MAENDFDIEQELCEYVRDGRSLELDQYLQILSDVSNLLITIIQQHNEHFSLLMLAALHGHDEVVRLILIHSPTAIELDGSMYDLEGNVVQHVTALWCALDRGHFIVAHTLIDLGGADVNHGPYYPLLIDASRRGRFDIVQFLVENGYADVNQTVTNDENKFSSLILSAHYGHQNIVAYLLEKGADIEYMTHIGQDTALTTAAREDHLEVIQLLCWAGASATAKNCDGKTPIILVAEHGAFEAIDFLLEYTHDETTFDNLELIASSYMVSNDVITLHERQHMVRLLKKSLEQRSYFHVPKTVAQPIVAYNFQKECQTIDELDQIQYDDDRLCVEALLICERIFFIRKKEERLFRLLLQHGDMCIERNQFDCSLHLYSHLFHLNQPTKLTTILHRFIWMYCKMITAKISIPVDQFLQICHLIVEPSHDKSIDRLIKNALYLVAIAAKVLQQSTVSNEDRRFIIRWIKKLCQKQYTTRQGLNLLHLSVNDQIYYATDNEGRNDITSAISFPNLDSTQLLLEYGKRWIDVDAKDQDRGETALHIVSHNFRKNVQGTATKIIELLLDAGAHIDYVNNDGKTPLDQSSDTGIRTLLRSKQTPSRLKCLCAHLINIHQISYDHVWPNPTALTTFVQLHNQPSSEDDYFGLFN